MTAAARVLLVERLDNVRRLTLNRPEKRNALSAELLQALYAAVDEAVADRATSVLIVRGAGSSFSAGFDMSGRADGRPATVPEDHLKLRSSALAMNRVWDCPIPIIAQVHGWCLAGATDLAFNCDVVIAANTAQIGHPGVRSQGTPTTNMWLYYAGPQLAKWLLLTGQNISGRDAAAQGLVLSAHDEEDLDDVVLEAARKMALIDRDVLVSNKAVLNHAIELMGRSQLQRFAAAQDAIAHASEANVRFRERVGEIGIRAAIAERDSRFQEE